MKDLSLREIAIFAPLLVLVIIMGVYPKMILGPVAPSVARIVSGLEQAGLVQPQPVKQLADLPVENPQ